MFEWLDGGIGIVRDYSCYTIRFMGNEKANLDAASWFSKELGCPVTAKENAKVEEDFSHTHVEDLWDWLEPYAAVHPEASFSLEGYIENHGYDEDFRIEAVRGALRAYRSGWYIDESKDNYESYDEFCEMCQDDDGNPLCSQEEFDALGDDLFFFETCESGCFKTIVLDKVPLDGPAVTRDELLKLGM